MYVLEFTLDSFLIFLSQTQLQAREDDAGDGEVRFHVEESYDSNEENTSPFKHEGILIKKASTGGWKWTSLLPGEYEITVMFSLMRSNVTN